MPESFKDVGYASLRIRWSKKKKIENENENEIHNSDRKYHFHLSIRTPSQTTSIFYALKYVNGHV